MEEENLISSRVCLALMRLGTKIASGFDQHFRTLNLTQAQFRLLLTIWEKGNADGITPSQLASELLLERSSVSTLVEVLVGRGWIVRQPGENRRSYQLVLTPQGGQVLQQAIPSAVSLADYILSELGPGELLQLRDLLSQVEVRLRDYDPPLTPSHQEINS